MRTRNRATTVRGRPGGLILVWPFICPLIPESSPFPLSLGFSSVKEVCRTTTSESHPAPRSYDKGDFNRNTAAITMSEPTDARLRAVRCLEFQARVQPPFYPVTHLPRPIGQLPRGQLLCPEQVLGSPMLKPHSLFPPGSSPPTLALELQTPPPRGPALQLCLR